MKSPARLRLDILRNGARVAWSSLRLLVTRNPGLKLISLGLAFALWSFVNVGERDAEEPLQVPLELRNIPASLVMTSPRIDFVDLRVIGPRTLLGRIDRTRLSLSLDLDGVRPGPAVFRVGPESFNLPRGVRVTRINPSQITLELERLGRKSVPVHLQLSGELGEDFRLAESTVAPEAIEISGPASDVREISEVVTEPLDLGRVGVGELQEDLVLQPIGEYLTYSVSRVSARLRIEDVVVSRSFGNVPVQFADDGAGVRVVPGTVDLTVRGPRRLVRVLELTPDCVSVDPGDVTPDGGVRKPLVQLPEGVELESLEPPEVRVELPPPPPAATQNMTPGQELRITPADVPPQAATKPAAG